MTSSSQECFPGSFALLHGVIRSFLLPSSIPLCTEHTLLIHPLVDIHLDCFQFGDILLFSSRSFIIVLAFLFNSTNELIFMYNMNQRSFLTLIYYIQTYMYVCVCDTYMWYSLYTICSSTFVEDFPFPLALLYNLDQKSFGDRSVTCFWWPLLLVCFRHDQETVCW